MTMPTNIDSTYADTGGADVVLHQQHHDLLHARYNQGRPPGVVSVPSASASWCRPGWTGTNGFTSSAGFGAAADTIVFTPVVVGFAVTADRIGVNITTAVAASTVRLGIYSSNSAGQPSARLLDAGTVSSATTGFKEITISQALEPGLYWLAHSSSSATVIASYAGASAVCPVGAVTTAAAPVASTYVIRFRALAGSSAGLPDPAGSVDTSNAGYERGWPLVRLVP